MANERQTFVFARTKQLGPPGNEDTLRQFGDIAGAIELSDDMLSFTAFCDGIRNRLIIPLDDGVKQKLEFNSERDKARLEVQRQKDEVAQQRKAELASEPQTQRTLSPADSAP